MAQDIPAGPRPMIMASYSKSITHPILWRSYHKQNIMIILPRIVEKDKVAA
jgi:hypothetical protein